MRSKQDLCNNEKVPVYKIPIITGQFQLIQG
jgi:hypothetical protein